MLVSCGEQLWRSGVHMDPGPRCKKAASERIRRVDIYHRPAQSRVRVVVTTIVASWPGLYRSQAEAQWLNGATVENSLVAKMKHHVDL